MQLAIENAFKKTFEDTHYAKYDKDVLGVHEGYTVFSEKPLSTYKGREVRDRNQFKSRDKRTEFYECVEWTKTKEPYKHRALTGEELEIHNMYLRISKEPEFAF